MFDNNISADFYSEDDWLLLTGRPSRCMFSGSSLGYTLLIDVQHNLLMFKLKAYLGPLTIATALSLHLTTITDWYILAHLYPRLRHIPVYAFLGQPRQ